MRLVRTILALAISASLALLPMGTSAAPFPIAQYDATSGMEMDASGDMDMFMDDCCPDHMKTAPSHADGYKCPMGLCCAGAFFAIGNVSSHRLDLFFAKASRLAFSMDRIVPVRGGNPPFRPPRA
jgi:hypothetical protein